MADEIRISVRNSICITDTGRALTCGNRYTVSFDFDAPWDRYPQKVVRIVWYDSKDRKLRYAERLTDSDRADLPPFYRTDLLLIGVYAGETLTSAAAAFPCRACITDNQPVHGQPEPDIYAQLLKYLQKLAEADGFVMGETASALDGAVRYTAGIAVFSPIGEE